MRALIAEDNPTTRLLLESTLAEWGYDVVATCNGAEAWQELQNKEPPELILLDWKMPGMDGIEVCRKLRRLPEARAVHVILVTARGDKEDVVLGLEAGADDYVTKPFEPSELRARLQAGARIVELQKALADRVRELESALARVKQLQGLLPICSYCKKIRDDRNYWQQVESYIASHSEAQFSHSICPECHERVVKPELEAIQNKRQANEPPAGRRAAGASGGVDPRRDEPGGSPACHNPPHSALGAPPRSDPQENPAPVHPQADEPQDRKYRH